MVNSGCFRSLRWSNPSFCGCLDTLKRSFPSVWFLFPLWWLLHSLKWSIPSVVSLSLKGSTPSMWFLLYILSLINIYIYIYSQKVNSLGGFSFSQRVNSLGVVSLIYTYTQKVNSLGRFPFSSLSLVLWSLFPHTSIYTRKQESKSIQHCKTNKNTHASFFRCVQNKLWRGSLMEVSAAGVWKFQRRFG